MLLSAFLCKPRELPTPEQSWVQALLPPEHSVCQAGLADVPRQLNALAALHATVRAGRTAVVSEMRLAESSFGGGMPQLTSCLLAPSHGTCAAAPWSGPFASGVTVRNQEATFDICYHSGDFGWSQVPLIAPAPRYSLQLRP